MGKPNLLTRVRWFIGGVAWDVFLWSIKMTADEYWTSVIEDARRESKSEKDSAWFTN